IKHNQNEVKTSLKKGLKGKSKILLERIINEGHVNKLHWITTLYILSRKAKYNKYRELCEIILEKLISQCNDITFDIYNKIRKVSYVVLDSHFSPIPVTLSFQHMVFDGTAFVDELLKYNSSLLDTVDKMNDLLETTLYAENNVLLSSCLNNRILYKNITEKLNKNKGEYINIINELLVHSDSLFYKNNMVDEIRWDKDKNLSIGYKFKDKIDIAIDTMDLEMKAHKKIGNTCYIAYSNSSDSLRFRTVYALSGNKDKNEIPIKLLNVIKLACNDYFKFKDNSYKEIDNGYLEDVVIKKIITYLFRNILNDDYFCEYNDLGLSNAYILTKGSKNAAAKIEDIIQNSEINNKDIKHEINAVKQCLNEINYKGIILVCLGSLRFVGKKKKSICELDGVIFIPRNEDKFLYVVEAKNKNPKSKRYSEAKRQLNDGMKEQIKENNIDIEINELTDYGAILTCEVSKPKEKER
ncbi:hypothetical protein BUZ08_13530, partial [Staphylococcus gallinarum]